MKILLNFMLLVSGILANGSPTPASIVTPTAIVAPSSSNNDLFYKAMTNVLQKQNIKCTVVTNNLECIAHPTGLKFTIPETYSKEIQAGLSDGTLRPGTRQTIFFEKKPGSSVQSPGGQVTPSLVTNPQSSGGQTPVLNNNNPLLGGQKQ